MIWRFWGEFLDHCLGYVLLERESAVSRYLGARAAAVRFCLEEHADVAWGVLKLICVTNGVVKL